MIVGIALWLSAQQIEVGYVMGQGGDFMPKLCAGLWILISAPLIMTSAMMPNNKDENAGIHVKGFLGTLILLIVYVFLLKPIGFVLTSIVYMFIQMMMFVPQELRSRNNYILFVVISVALPIIVNLVFVNVFSLILPTGIL